MSCDLSINIHVYAYTQTQTHTLTCVSPTPALAQVWAVWRKPHETTHANTYTNMLTYNRHICIHTLALTYTGICVRAHIYTYMHACTHARMHPPHTHTNTHTHIYMHARTHAFTINWFAMNKNLIQIYFHQHSFDQWIIHLYHHHYDCNLPIYTS